MRPYHLIMALKAREAERDGKDREASVQWRAACKAAVTDRQRNLYAAAWRRSEDRYNRKIGALFLSKG